MEQPSIRGLSGWKPLARGGFTLVWEARQDLLARLVAVKVYQPGLAAGVCDTFAREAGVAGRLSNHPGVVTVYDAGLLPDSRPYVMMELCPRGSLTHWLDPENLRTEEQIRRVGIRVADALAAVHARGVIHRDVKPANILIDSFGSPRLADFGLATVAGTEAAATDPLRLTPAYAPPEAFGVSAAAESGDVYSLAATMYALLAGRPPRSLAAAGDVQQMAEVAAEPLTPLPGVNWFLMDVLMAALNSDPEARPSAAELRDRLSDVPAPRTRKLKPRLVDHGQASVRDLQRPALSGHSATTSADHATPGSTAAAARVPDAVAAAPRRRPRRLGVLALAVAAVTLAASGTAWLVAEPVSSGAPTVITQSAGPGTLTPSADSSPAAAAAPGPQTATPTPAPAVGDAEGSEPSAAAITVHGSVDSAAPFETVQIRGRYRGGADTFLQVQRWADGSWQAFPVPAKTNKSGQFTAYVELGRPSRYRLRVRDPRSGVKSEPFSLVIKG